MKKDSRFKVKHAFTSLFKWGDLLLLVVLIVAVGLTVWFATRTDGTSAEVYIDGELKYTLSLAEDKTLELADCGMTICVENGKVFVTHSDCPEQLCVHAAPINSAGGMIVCLPNKVVIKIASKEVDAVT